MIKWGGCTDVGRTRPMNEDGYYISEYSREFEALYAIVADGMGGHKAGEIASSMALEQVSETVNRGFRGDMSVSRLKACWFRQLNMLTNQFMKKVRLSLPMAVWAQP